MMIYVLFRVISVDYNTNEINDPTNVEHKLIYVTSNPEDMEENYDIKINRLKELEVGDLLSVESMNKSMMIDGDIINFEHYVEKKEVEIKVD